MIAYRGPVSPKMYKIAMGFVGGYIVAPAKNQVLPGYQLLSL